MSLDENENKHSETHHSKSRAAEIANTFEWLTIAFILAFIIRAFIMEPYRIPTGSMADSLMGIHFRIRCKQCGYPYNYGFEPAKYNLPEDTIPASDVPPYDSRCPSCGFYQPTGGNMPIANGDRILVLKCIYQFFEPKRWDVIVFKNPLDPTENYIKRLIALPGEAVEIIDGDIYIDGRISRKPPKVQQELWMTVFDNDYQPVTKSSPNFNRHKWFLPFDLTESGWTVDEKNQTVFRLDSPNNQTNTFFYDTSVGNSFKTCYPYNDVRLYAYMPYSSDLMTRFYISSASNGHIGIAQSKYETLYKAWIDFSACEMVISKIYSGRESILERKSVDTSALNRQNLVSFANVDHQLIFRFGDIKLRHNLGDGPDDAGPRLLNIEPKVEIFGSGKLTLSHIAIFRDIHYTTASAMRRAEQGNPMTLKENEFFVLGDNSPNSQDSRWWNSPGIANNRGSYPQGIVPRDYLVGKALVVYMPSFFEPMGKSKNVFVPCINGVRFIYGGSKKNY